MGGLWKSGTMDTGMAGKTTRGGWRRGCGWLSEDVSWYSTMAVCSSWSTISGICLSSFCWSKTNSILLLSASKTCRKRSGMVLSVVLSSLSFVVLFVVLFLLLLVNMNGNQACFKSLAPVMTTAISYCPIGSSRDDSCRMSRRFHFCQRAKGSCDCCCCCWANCCFLCCWATSSGVGPCQACWKERKSLLRLSHHWAMGPRGGLSFVVSSSSSSCLLVSVTRGVLLLPSSSATVDSSDMDCCSSSDCCCCCCRNNCRSCCHQYLNRLRRSMNWSACSSTFCWTMDLRGTIVESCRTTNISWLAWICWIISGRLAPGCPMHVQ